MFRPEAVGLCGVWLLRQVQKVINLEVPKRRWVITPRWWELWSLLAIYSCVFLRKRLLRSTRASVPESHLYDGIIEIYEFSWSISIKPSCGPQTRPSCRSPPPLLGAAPARWSRGGVQAAKRAVVGVPLWDAGWGSSGKRERFVRTVRKVPPAPSALPDRGTLLSIKNDRLRLILSEWDAERSKYHEKCKEVDVTYQHRLEMLKRDLANSFEVRLQEIAQ